MPYLGDYIGHLLSEVTIARMRADLEAVRVAELYAGHPLLRNMPVPRFRLPTIELDVPLVVREIEEPETGGQVRGAPTLAEMRRAFDKTLEEQLARSRIRVGSAQARRLQAALDKREELLDQPAEVAVDVLRAAHELASAAAAALTRPSGPIGAEKRQEFERQLKQTATIALIKQRRPPARVQVLVTTAEVREAGPDEVITHFHLKVTEEAFEWAIIESAGEEQRRLVSE